MKKISTTRTADSIAGICPHCGYSHSREIRHRIIRRALPATAAELAAAWPCLWAPQPHDKGQASSLLYRDLRAVGAIPEASRYEGLREWVLQ